MSKKYYLNTPEGKIEVTPTHYVGKLINIIWNESNFVGCSAIIGREALINPEKLEEIDD